MKNLSRGTWIALAAIAAVPATVAIAKTADNAGWHTMSPETRARLQDGRIAMMKAALQLTPDQEKLWTPVETQVRDAYKAREARMEEWKKKREEWKADHAKGERKKPDLADRFERMSKRLSERADRMKAFSGAFSPFYASLSDEQKEVLRPLMRELRVGGGRRGHRFADGWGPGGRHGGGWFGHHGHEGRGGPQMQNDDDNDGSPDQAPAEPDKKG
jgi:hypothetical protein